MLKTLPPATLSRELREGRTPELARRRWAIGLSYAGGLIGMIVGAYQTGILRRLPDILPGKVFDAEKVDASDYAYSRMQSPDGPLMGVTYLITASLAAAGGKDRAEQQPWLPLAGASKAWYDLVVAGRLAQEEWAENKALCSWCQVATAFSAVTAALLTPEAVRAGRTLLRSGDQATA
jgi:uncharacterized membrane protein